MATDPAYQGTQIRYCGECEKPTAHQVWDARAGIRSHNHLGKSLWWAHCSGCSTQYDLTVDRDRTLGNPQDPGSHDKGRLADTQPSRHDSVRQHPRQQPSALT